LRAWEAFLKYSFWKDYRQQPSVQVNATAVAQAEQIVTEEKRQQLIKLREQQLSEWREKMLHEAAIAQASRGLTENGNRQTSAPQTPVGLKRLPTNPPQTPGPPLLTPETTEEEGGAEGWGDDLLA
jgi:hypothetical protein